MTEKTNGPHEVQVHVTFAAANQPYNSRYDATATVAEVLEAAMSFFDIQTDGTSRYFLMAGGNEQAPTVMLGALAEEGPGHSRSLKFSLRTETTSGDA